MNKLYRSNSDYVFAGVCGGLGQFFGIDSTLVRLAWVIAALFFGSGILLYLIFCFIVPRER